MNLSRRGCHVGALGIATLLLSLDRSDPTHASLWLDTLALRANRPRALCRLDACAADGGLSPLGRTVGALPGWQLSLALALRRQASSPPPGASPPPRRLSRSLLSESTPRQRD